MADRDLEIPKIYSKWWKACEWWTTRSIAVDSRLIVLVERLTDHVRDAKL